MGLQNEIWVADIEKVLYQTDLSWLEFATSHDSYAGQSYGSGYRVVNIPQASSYASGATLNYSSTLPRSVAKRTDSILSYNIDVADSGVISFTYQDALQVSYDLRQSLIRQNIEMLSQFIGTTILEKWAFSGLTGSVASRVVTTSGATTSAWLEGSQTGSRKNIAIADIQKLSRILDLDNMPQSDRYLILPASMYTQLFSLNEVQNSIAFYGFQRGAVLPNKELPMLFGFNVLMRPTVLSYTTGNARNSCDAYGVYAYGATDNLAAIAFHRSAVAKAMAGIFAYQGIEADPLMSGGQSLMAVVPFGATRLRTDNQGVAILVQGT